MRSPMLDTVRVCALALAGWLLATATWGLSAPLATRMGEPRLVAATEDNPFWRALVLLLLDTGLKRDEVLALRVADIHLEGRLNTTCVPHNGGTVYLNIQLATGAGPDYTGTRRHMNLAVVLDRSGSMADDRKLDYAKKAISSLVDRLSPSDYLSIIIYDDQIETLLPMQPVRDRNRIKDLLTHEIF